LPTDRPRALLLDLDDTLLDSVSSPSAIYRTCDETAARLGVPSHVVRDANAAEFITYWTSVESRWVVGAYPTSDLLFEAWTRTLAACGSVDEDLARWAAERFWELDGETYLLYADGERLLSSVDRAEIHLVIVTNGAGDLQRRKVERLGLLERVDIVMISGEQGVAKPDPEIFLRALAAVDVAPENAWHVGDNLRSDVGGAAAAGIHPVWLNRERREPSTEIPPHAREIQTLDEVSDLLR
jgi:putative hydrolase of the HAD superfamily